MPSDVALHGRIGSKIHLPSRTPTDGRLSRTNRRHQSSGNSSPVISTFELPPPAYRNSPTRRITEAKSATSRDSRLRPDGQTIQVKSRCRRKQSAATRAIMHWRGLNPTAPGIYRQKRGGWVDVFRHCLCCLGRAHFCFCESSDGWSILQQLKSLMRCDAESSTNGVRRYIPDLA